jgi:hypothetical protein
MGKPLGTQSIIDSWQKLVLRLSQGGEIGQIRGALGLEIPYPVGNFSITAGKPADVELGRGLSREQKSGLTKE